MLNKHKPKQKGKKELIKLMLSKPYLLANLQMFGCVYLATTSHFFRGWQSCKQSSCSLKLS